MATTSETSEYLTRAEVAERLRVSVRSVDRYIRRGALPAVRLPGDRLVRIPAAALGVPSHHDAA